jgi:drug/metabolite transporter (DMT)-like permease
LASGLVLAVFFWGGNNTGTRFLVQSWPPIWTGGTRFLCAGLVLLALLRWTGWFGPTNPISPELRKRLWWRGGLSLAVYIICFNWALRYTSASHVALYLAAAPVWALLWEGKPSKSWLTVQRYGAAALALCGVVALFWPALRGGGHWVGELLGLMLSISWTNYGRQSRALGAHVSGAEVSAHTMLAAGIMLLPLGVIEVARAGLVWRTDLALVQAYCIFAGGVAAFALWNNGLRHWPASQVLLFNNLIPVSTMAWAHFCLNEPVTIRFWIAMLLIIAGVILGQTSWQKVFPAIVSPVK